MSFGALLVTALAGTERRDPSATLATFDNLTPASRLLRSASYEGMRRLAGRPLDPVEGVISLDPCPPETLPAIPPSAQARMLDILADRPALLVEWLDLVAERRLRVSHDCLPDLLEHARTRDETHDLVMQVGGERLVWLANLNPAWHFAARVDPEQQLGLGPPQERARALRHIRRQDVARGRELLQVQWRSERADTRSALLDALAVGLSAEDEPLLQAAVQGSRKELREKGLRLIRRVPRSHFSQRWTERARELVAFGTQIEVREPDEPEPAWIDDGLDPRPPKGIGTTAWILQQVLALTPPSIWPHGTLSTIQSSDWSQPLLSGLAQAAVAYADADWCEELLMAGANPAARSVHSDALIGALAPGRAEAVLRRLLDTRTNGLATLAASLKHAWSEDFSHVMLARLPELLDKWHYATSTLLHEAPLRLDPRVLHDARGLLDSDSAPTWARPALQRLVTTLAFRLAMRKELEPD